MMPDLGEAEEPVRLIQRSLSHPSIHPSLASCRSREDAGVRGSCICRRWLPRGRPRQRAGGSVSEREIFLLQQRREIGRRICETGQEVDSPDSNPTKVCVNYSRKARVWYHMVKSCQRKPKSYHIQHPEDWKKKYPIIYARGIRRIFTVELEIFRGKYVPRRVLAVDPASDFRDILEGLTFFFFFFLGCLQMRASRNRIQAKIEEREIGEAGWSFGEIHVRPSWCST